jgi:PKD repeat protein
MIIRSGDMALVVEDVADTIQKITRLADTYEGFVVSSNSWNEGERTMGDISIRVKAARFNEAIDALRQLAVEVTQESTSGQDVTEEYIDLTARLKNLEASEAQLLELMKQAGNVAEILEVQKELTRTRGDIEQTKGRMQYLEQSSDMSFIQVRLVQSKLTVEFNASSRNVREGDDVRFFPEVAGGFSPYSYEWDFGDGETSNEPVPVHSYKTDGTYTVKVTVTDDENNTEFSMREDYINVEPGWDPGSIAGSAWNGLVVFGRVMANIFIWLGIFSPVWIVILVILYFAWWRRRKKAT